MTYFALPLDPSRRLSQPMAPPTKPPWRPPRVVPTTITLSREDEQRIARRTVQFNRLWVVTKLESIKNGLERLPHDIERWFRAFPQHIMVRIVEYFGFIPLNNLAFDYENGTR